MSGERTTRQEHPLPAVIMHWTHLISMAILIFTGFYIHSSFFNGSMAVERQLHFIFAFVLIYVAIIRVYWAFFGHGSASQGSHVKERDYRFFLPQAQNRGKFGQTIRYYLFLRRTHPATAKYNPLQKGTYVFWLILIILQAITGFALWEPTMSFFSPLTNALGGLNWMRIGHYFITWIFIITIAVHIYLVLAEDIKQFPLMFWWRAQDTSPAKEKA
ncbi:MAG TPA: Ni/Fe-hydrogenase, b-type cytochrome subunit [Candidatus Aquicultor sp.]|jgi:Ni/Fe-hydrogenase 1 B-type cytochrome subunit